eukprot:7992193-Pyramimonas_sp.AAC.1
MCIRDSPGAHPRGLHVLPEPNGPRSDDHEPDLHRRVLGLGLTQSNRRVDAPYSRTIGGCGA